MTTTVEDIIHSYANYNKPFQMIGAIEVMRRDFMSISIEKS